MPMVDIFVKSITCVIEPSGRRAKFNTCCARPLDVPKSGGP